MLVCVRLLLGVRAIHIQPTCLTSSCVLLFSRLLPRMKSVLLHHRQASTRDLIRYLCNATLCTVFAAGHEVACNLQVTVDQGNMYSPAARDRPRFACELVFNQYSRWLAAVSVLQCRFWWFMLLDTIKTQAAAITGSLSIRSAQAPHAWKIVKQIVQCSFESSAAAA